MTPDASSKRILLVDDEEGVLEALALTLKRAREFKAEIAVARNADEALSKLGERPYSLVIADYRMPGMSGVDLLVEVRARHPHTVRALLTGYNDVEIAMEAMEKAHIHYYLQKPWDNDRLRSTILEALDGGWSKGRNG